MRYLVGMLVLELGLILTGCRSQERITELRISPNFTDAELIKLMDAVDMWCRVSEETCLPVSIAADNETANVRKLYDWPEDYPRENCSSFTEYKGKAWIEIVEKSPCQVNAYLMAHEIGHALAPDAGGIWGEGGGHLMSHTIEPGFCVTETDIEHLCSAREEGCNDWQTACLPGREQSQ